MSAAPIKPARKRIRARKQGRTNRDQHDPNRIAEALRQGLGIYSAAARLIGCDRQTIANYVERYPELQEELKDIREGAIDIAESQLLTQMNSGNMTAIIFFLKTQGKHRGYIERGELTGPGGGPLEHAQADPRNMTTAQLQRLVAEQPR